MKKQHNIFKQTSKKKQQEIDKINNSPIKVGDIVGVRYNAFHLNDSRIKDNENTEQCVVLEIRKKGLIVKKKDSSVYKDGVQIKYDDVLYRNVLYAGANPFDEESNNIRSIAFTLQSILFNLNVLDEKEKNEYTVNGIVIKELNWNPYVYVNGEKKYYQRDFCWTLQDKQNLIQSIYLGVECGKIVVRYRDYRELEKLAEKGETELYFNDIVDGKQRLNALREFILNKFPDLDGNYYEDLSYNSQNLLINNQLLSFAEMNDVTDEQVLKQFLRMNFSGIPQSIEHLNYIKSLL